MKKFISLLLAFSILLSFFAISITADAGELDDLLIKEKSFNSLENKWPLDSTYHSITFAEGVESILVYNMKVHKITLPLSADGRVCLDMVYGLTELVIPEGYTAMPQVLYTDLKKIELPSTITTIGYRSFVGGHKSTEITIPESVTSIDRDAFPMAEEYLVFNVYAGSYAHRYVYDKGYKFNVIGKCTGDANNDGRVNEKDTLALRKYTARQDVEINVESADANGDGAIDAKDILLLRKYLAKWDVTLAND